MLNIQISEQEKKKVKVLRDNLPSLKSLCEKRHEDLKGKDFNAAVAADWTTIKEYHKQIGIEKRTSYEHWNTVVPLNMVWFYTHILGYESTQDIIQWDVSIPTLDEIQNPIK